MHSESDDPVTGTRVRRGWGPALAVGLAMGLAGMLSLSCSPSSPSDPGQTQGQIQVNVSTSGTGLPSSFTVRLNGGSARSVSPDGSVTFASLSAGNYQVELSVPGNCTISGSAERTVGVQEGSSSTVTYSVSCSAVPTGAIGVTTSTTGSPVDPDGYTVSVDGGAGRSIGVNDNLLVPDLGLGDHEVALSGVADNCLVQGANPRTVSVTENQTTQVEFEIVCSATTGRVDVTVTTTGAGLDPDGYVVDLDDGAVTRPVQTNGTVEFTGVEQGGHTLGLEDVASNCTVEGNNPVSVDVVAGETTAASFTVECEATTGSLQVTVTTTGEVIDPDGYSVVLDGGVSTQLVDANDTIVFGSLAPGEHTVALQNVAENCTVTSTNPATADVLAGQQADVAFSVVCEELTGSVQVNLSTTGDEPDPDGYTVSLDGGSGVSVGTNGSHTFPDVVIGEHEIEVGGVAFNCGVQGSNPRAVTVSEGVTAQVDFDVVCSATAGQIEVTVTTSGEDLDSNGYTVDLDGTSSQAVATNGTTTFTGVSEGSHTLTLQNIASNCNETSPNPTSTDVTAGNTSNVAFTVECTRTTGDIRVTTTTSGSPPDSDGYEVTVSGVGSRDIGNNDEELFEDLQPVDYTVELEDVAVNCTVSGGAVRNNVTVNADEETVVAYTIECVPLVGDLRVNVATTGEDQDPDGYDARLDGDPGTDLPVDIDGSVTFFDVSTGSHSVTLVDVADNCDIVGDDTKSIDVEFDTTVDLGFDVTCEATTGDLRVTANTTGDEPDASYTVSVDGEAAQTLQANGDTLTFAGLEPGDHEVVLDDVASNCTVTGGAVDSVSVTAGSTTLEVFDVTCEATTGSIDVTATTTGLNLDPDGYTVDLDGTEQMSIQANDTVTFTEVAEGEHTLTLSGEELNCTITSENPTDTTVTAGETATVGFTIECT